MAKRGRKPKVKPGGSTLEKLKREGHPDVQYFADIEKRDSTEVFNKEKGMHYRWCSEAVLGLRRRQGYEVVDDKNVETGVPGGSVSWGAEGKQAKIANRDLVLCKMPQERFDMRMKITREKQDEAQQNLVNQTDREAHGVDPQMGGVLPSNDPFVKDLRGGK